MTEFRAAIFDLDGVISDSARYHYQAWKRLADELSIPFDEQANQALKGVGRMESLAHILHLGQRAQDFSDHERRALAARKNDYYRALIAAMGEHDVLPGARSLLLDLRHRGVAIGLASASRNAPEILNRLELINCFDAIANPATIAGKPAPDLFLAAARQLAVAPAECIAFEDAEAGITAIKAAGMTAIGVGVAAALPRADQVVTSLAQFNVDDYRWRPARQDEPHA
ncbi:MAG: beta-phosphoglucomutase [Wenzhouxiangellaceae bacterium]